MLPATRPVRRPSQNAINNSSDLNNSSGFKSLTIKKNTGVTLRPNSRDQLGQSIDNFNQQFFQIIPIESEENTFCSSIKAEIINIQQEIDQQDFDKKFRTSSIQGLQNSSLTTTKKWISLIQSEQPITKQLENKLQQCTDLDKFIQNIGCIDIRQALSKTLKMLATIDLFFTKLTELQSIHFLQYLTISQPHSFKTKEILDRIPNATRQIFQLIPQANLALFRDILANKPVQQIPEDQSNLKQTIQQLIQEKKNLYDQLGEKDQEVIQLTRQLGEARESILVLQHLQQQSTRQLRQSIQSEQKYREVSEVNKKLQEENKKFQDKIAQWDKQSIEKSHTENTALSQSFLSMGKSAVFFHQTNPDASYYSKIIDELRDTYNELIEKQQKDISTLSQKITDMQIKCEQYQSNFHEANKKVEILKELRDDLYRRFQQKYKDIEEYESSYEAALQEETIRMQNGFQSKIQTLQEELDKTKKDSTYIQNELKRQLEREINVNRAITKKLSLFIKTQ